MALKMPEKGVGLNMTPMIDIVFQLILFFLFNLRFKSMKTTASRSRAER